MKKLIGTLFVFALIISGLTLQSYQSHAEEVDPKLSPENFEIEIDTLYRVLDSFSPDVVQTVIDEINNDDSGSYEAKKKKKKKKKGKDNPRPNSCTDDSCGRPDHQKWCDCHGDSQDQYMCGCLPGTSGVVEEGAEVLSQ